jgi:Ulp1 protease family, C-terminal catalytic domain
MRDNTRSKESPPPAKKHSIEDAFKIPHRSLIPSLSLSIRDLLDTPIPAHIPPKDIHTNSFFSPSLPDDIGHGGAAYMQLVHLPIPPEEIITRLVGLLRQRQLDGIASVKYAHLTDHRSTGICFPLWVITYWEVISKARKARMPWVHAESWVQKHALNTKKAATAELANECLAYLHLLTLQPSKSHALDATHLWRLLGNHWLNDEVMNALLEKLRADVLSDRELVQRISIQNVFFSSKVVEAHSSAGATYQTARAYAWLFALGNQLAANEQMLLTIAHLGNTLDPENRSNGGPGNQHWVSLVVDVKSHSILYGDSLNQPMPKKFYDAFTWWMAQHAPRHSFLLKTLPITQQSDSFSCGPLAFHSLKQHVNVTAHLTSGKELDIVNNRLNLFASLAKHISQKV